MAYHLSCSLIGHSNDVRCCCSFMSGGQEVIVTGGRDGYIILWELGAGKQYELKRVIKNHSSYVNSLCIIPASPSSHRDEVLIASGSNDKTVLVHSLTQDAPVQKFEGHKDSVSGVIFLREHLISVSWDGTVCVWLDQPLKTEAHAPSAYAIAGLVGVNRLMGGIEGKFFLTGGADQLIKLWCWDSKPSVKCIKQFAGHTGTVRDIKVCSSGLFLSASNDQTVKQWDVHSGQCLKSVLAHDAYIYSLAVFPGMDGSASVTSGEDSTVKVWEGDVCMQTISLPALSVWSVHCLQNGDFVAGASDNVARVFTSNPERQAPESEIEQLDEEAGTFKSKEGQKLDASKFPGPEALSRPGKKHGDTQVVRNNNQLEVYQWNEGPNQWDLIGYASGKAPDQEEEEVAEEQRLPNGKWLYEGKEYDYIIPTEIEEDFGAVRKLKLPYNKETDPWVAAQQFLERNILPLSQLEQVANHIQKVAGPYVYTGSGGGGGGGDPFTGGARYIPGTAERQQFTASGVDPFTGGGRYVPGSAKGGGLPTLGGGSGFDSDPLTGGSRYVPPMEQSTNQPKVTFTQGKSDGTSAGRSNSFYPMVRAPHSQHRKTSPVSSYKLFPSPGPDYGVKVLAKLTEFNSSLSPSDALSESELAELHTICSELSKPPPSALFSEGHCRLLYTMLNWPRPLLFPVLDMVRLALLQPIGTEFFLKSDTGRELVDRFVLFSLGNGDQAKNVTVALRCLANTFSSSDGALLMVTCRQHVFQALDAQGGNSNRTAQIAIATILLNYCHFYHQKGECDDVFVFLKHMAKVLKSDATDGEAKFRILLAVGSMARMGRDMAGYLSSNGFKAMVEPLASQQDNQKVSECAKLLLSEL